MSGTSADGVSAALASFEKRKFKLLAYRTFPYSKSLRQKVARGPLLTAKEISTLDFQLGEAFARAAMKLLRAEKFPFQKIAVIGSHGQTIYHGPRDPIPSTFQIGEAALIAQKTKIPVVSDFRPQDVALGGEGAPLVPFFDHYFYGQGPVRAFQNIGGIANVTIVGRGVKNSVAFDTGPGNCLIDLAIQKLTRGRLLYDPSGNWAGRGRVQMKWIRPMMRHPYFKKRPPKSTGREEFGEKFLSKHLGCHLKNSPYDVLATLTYFTALTIFESLKDLPPPLSQTLSPLAGRGKGEGLKEIIVSGGGVKNRTLMRHLKELFFPIPVYSSEALGLPAQAKEPLAFAFFALRALQGETNHLPSTTGARSGTVLGKITLP